MVLMVLEEVALAIPKSESFTFPSMEMIIFWGFTSRWMMPLLWAASNPRDTWIAMLVASRILSLPFLVM